MNPLIPVKIGGALGAGARHLVGATMLARFGRFLMGLLVGILVKTGASEQLRLLLGVGVLGGFTTFSAFSLETWMMIERGQIAVATGYAGASLIGSVAALGLGLWLTRL
jgi:CrcB protein